MLQKEKKFKIEFQVSAGLLAQWLVAKPNRIQQIRP